MIKVHPHRLFDAWEREGHAAVNNKFLQVSDGNNGPTSTFSPDWVLKDTVQRDVGIGLKHKLDVGWRLVCYNNGSPWVLGIKDVATRTLKVVH